MSSATPSISGLPATPFDAAEFVREFNANGSVVVRGVLDADYIAAAKRALAEAIEKENNYHKTKNHKDAGMVLLCALYDRVFIDLFANQVFNEHFNSVMGPGCIVYAYTSSSMPPHAGNFSTRIHVDSPRMVPNHITNMGATILLDDFTEENGATWYLPGSQERLDAPSEEEFFAKGKRVIAPAGSVWFFNARVWHSGGQNHTRNWRHALTVNMCRPYMKQRIDIPRALEHAGVNLDGVPEMALQKLGFLSQVPANYDEYYAPPEKRKFKQRAE